MEVLFDVENQIQESGMIDVQFDYRIMTVDDFIIFDSNKYSKYLSKKHYIAAVYNGFNLLDVDIIDNYTGVKQYLVDYNIPQDIINEFDNAETFPDKNKVLNKYYDANDIDKRLYFAESDNRYIKRILMERY